MGLPRALYLMAHDQDRAVGVPEDGFGDAANDRSPYPPLAPATHHDEPSPYVLGQSDYLRGRIPYPKMCLCHLASRRAYLLVLFIELLTGSLLQHLRLFAVGERIAAGNSRPGARSAENVNSLLDEDNVQFGAGAVGQLYGGRDGKTGILRAVDASSTVVGKTLIGYTPPCGP